MTNGKLDCRAALVATGLTLAPSAAEAHLVETGLGPFYDGASHLVVSPEYWVPIVGVALFAGLNGKSAARSAVLVHPSGWLTGTLLGGLSDAPDLNAPTWLILMLIGGLVAVDIRLSTWLNVVLYGVSGLILGYSNGLAAVHSAQPTRAALGATAVVFIVTALAAATAAAASGWTRIAVRVAGSWIAASGLLALGWALH